VVQQSELLAQVAQQSECMYIERRKDVLEYSIYDARHLSTAFMMLVIAQFVRNLAILARVAKSP